MLKYLVVKYVPDLHRMEPRNIGVILYSDHFVTSKFYGAGAGVSSLDAITAPEFVTSPASYRQWVRYWQKSISRGASGETKFSSIATNVLSELKDTSRGNYLVVDGGMLPDVVGGVRGESTTDVLLLLLYNRLVSSIDAKDKVSDVFTDGNLSVGTVLVNPLESNIITSEKILRNSTIDMSLTTSGLGRDIGEISRSVLMRLASELNQDVIPSYEVECEIGSGKHPIRFDFALKNGRLTNLFELVKLGRRPGEVSVAKALKFDKVAEQMILRKSQMTAFVQLNEKQERKPEIVDALRTLGEVANVINLNETEEQVVDRLLGISVGIETHPS